MIGSTIRRAAVLAVTTVGLVGLVGTPAFAKPLATTTDLRLIGINDFHGNLEPPAGSSGRVTLPDGTTVNAGGAAYLATHVKELKAQATAPLVRSAGANIGAPPLNSSLFHDEPTVELLNSLGVTASTLGNH